MVVRMLNFGTSNAVFKQTLFLFHCFLSSLGLTGIIYGVSWKLHVILLAQRPMTEYNDWAIPFFHPNKPQQLIFFITAAIGLSLYYSLIYGILRQRGHSLEKTYPVLENWNARALFTFVILPVISNVLIYIWFRGRNSVVSLPSLLLCMLWFSVWLLPFYPRHSNVKEPLSQIKDKLCHIIEMLNRRMQGKFYVRLLLCLVAVIAVQLWTVFMPFLGDEILMINEYTGLPEQTLIGNSYVQNVEYVNRHTLGGLLKYDLEIDHGNSPRPRDGTFMIEVRTQSLDEFIEMNSSKYYYDESRQALVISGPMIPEELLELKSILGKEQEASLGALYYSSRELYAQLKKKKYTPEEVEFLQKNRLEMLWQILNRWVIHHHNFVLGPINEYALGKPLNDINIQYGALNIVLMKYLLEKTGGITYQNYFQKWYAFWPLYYALFIALAILLYRNVGYVALISVLVFGFVNKIDYQFLFLGPGLNPIRHFLDLPVIACVYLYLKGGKTGFLIAATLLIPIGVLNNTQFGLFLAGSFFITMLIKTCEERVGSALREMVCASTALAASGIIVLVGHVGQNQMASYYLEGFLGFIINTNRLSLIMLGLNISYLVLLAFSNLTKEWKYIALFLLFYSQGALVYYVWAGTDKHLLNVASILVLAGVAFIKLVIDCSSVKRFERLAVGSLIVLALIVVYIPGLLSYYATRQEYQEIFVTHKTYDWNLDKAKFRSTMDPAHFVDSIALIQAYAPSHNAIHLISKYDNVLPFLAKKYSAMPFFDLQWFLLTDREVNLCIEHIQIQKPEYLFVDTDIERDLNGEIVMAELRFISGPGGESLMRVQRLNLLKDIFLAVKKDYEPIKQGRLLTVYQRKATVEKDAVSDMPLLK
jgi:hypothetical protein